MAISIPIYFIKFWEYLHRFRTSKVDESSLNTKQSEHMVSSYFQITKKPQASWDNTTSISYTCQILKDFGKTCKEWTKDDLNTNKELVEACQILRESCKNVLEMLVGFVTGTEKPVVFLKQVSQVQVQYWILAHWDTPHIHTTVLQVFHRLIKVRWAPLFTIDIDNSAYF